MKTTVELETNPNIKVSGTFKDYYMLLNEGYSIYINCSRFSD